VTDKKEMKQKSRREKKAFETKIVPQRGLEERRLEDQSRRWRSRKVMKSENERRVVSKKYETKTKSIWRKKEKERNLDLETHPKPNRESIYSRPSVKIVQMSNDSDSKSEVERG